MTIDLSGYTDEGLVQLRKTRALDFSEATYDRKHAEDRCRDRLTRLRAIDAEMARREQAAVKDDADKDALTILSDLGFVQETQALAAIRQGMLDVVCYGTGTLRMQLSPIGVTLEAVKVEQKVSSDDGVSVAVSPKAWKEAGEMDCAAARSNLEPKEPYTVLQEAIGDVEKLLAQVGYPRRMNGNATLTIELELMKLRAMGESIFVPQIQLATKVAHRLADYMRAFV